MKFKKVYIHHPLHGRQPVSMFHGSNSYMETLFLVRLTDAAHKLILNSGSRIIIIVTFNSENVHMHFPMSFLFSPHFNGNNEVCKVKYCHILRELKLEKKKCLMISYCSFASVSFFLTFFLTL